MSRRQSIKTMHSITNSNFQIQITFYSVPCFLQLKDIGEYILRILQIYNPQPMEQFSYRSKDQNMGHIWSI